jgi:hypothetical protein
MLQVLRGLLPDHSITPLIETQQAEDLHYESANQVYVPSTAVIFLISRNITVELRPGHYFLLSFESLGQNRIAELSVACALLTEGRKQAQGIYRG